MARAKAVTEEAVERTMAMPAAKKKYALNGYNFTAVGEAFLSLCKPEIEVDETNTALINSAEEQVKLGILKLVK